MATNSWSSIENINKTSSLFYLISQGPGVDEIHLYVKVPDETKDQFLINKWESTD